MKKRLDLQMVDQGKASSRTRAQDLIKSGAVFVDGFQASSASQQVESNAKIEVQESELTRYVSRGGLKLEGALKVTGLSVVGLEILDVGISTGGFSDCLLKSGAKHVTGVDVGHGQLHPLLKDESRLTCIEGVNARELDRNSQVMAKRPGGGWPIAVVDVSFISLTLIMSSVFKVLSSEGQVLTLVKPQFEVGPEGLGKGGLVKNSSLYAEVEKKIEECCQRLGGNLRQYFDSAIEGKDGNREFFAWIQKTK
jgi:23S rRNA (cytidine1920-2'-O)/16S rRNA (cytidine1409-2'-O)-methyltransferase